MFKAHLELAHSYWQKIVMPGDIVIDATCGNGHDTLFLANLEPGKLYALDIQKEALENTAALVGNRENIVLLQRCHSLWPEDIEENSVKLIVYNLGYLPGGDKAKTTMTFTTLRSLQEALRLIKPGGAISVTCYPGHPEGAKEEHEIMNFVDTLDKRIWSCCHHRWLNRVRAPSLLLIQNSFDTVGEDSFVV